MAVNEGQGQGTASGQPLVHAQGVVPTQLPAGMIPNLDQKPIFVSLQETREVVHGSKVRNSRSGASHTYAIKFHLIDSAGKAHFAAVGYDGGDSHYQYSNQPEFPALSCHNKQEVKLWAERIINASQQSSGSVSCGPGPGRSTFERRLAGHQSPAVCVLLRVKAGYARWPPEDLLVSVGFVGP